MTRVYLIIGFLLFSIGHVIAQITDDPAVLRKSAVDTYINKIEITDQHTVISMKFVSKTAKQRMDDLLKSNPKLARELSQLDPVMRQMYMKRYLRQSTNTISFQPSSYLLTKDGKRYEFVKALNIPVSPDNIEAELGKSYYFKVYFEKLPPGYESIDIIENEIARQGNLSYWNFFGVEVNNPAEPIARQKPEPSQQVQPEAVRILLTGRVLDAETDRPIAAKIVCVQQSSNIVFDSINTSKLGNFEFSILPDNYLYEISAEGYETREEEFDLSSFKKSRTFTRDFFLQPLKMASEVPPMIEDKIDEEDIVIIEEQKPKSAPEVVNENTFRLNKVYFKVGEAVILPDSYEQLEGLVDMMTNKPAMKIQLEGHTDNQGDSKLNQKLSLQRAFKVREYLINHGIDGQRIKFVGYGDTRPIAPNNNEENRQKNRRVEFVLL